MWAKKGRTFISVNIESTYIVIKDFKFKKIRNNLLIPGMIVINIPSINSIADPIVQTINPIIFLTVENVLTRLSLSFLKYPL